MRPPLSEFTLSKGLSEKTVALVGGAASIQGKGAGEEINSHDYVVRVNNGFYIPPGLESDVGTRTDIVYHALVTHPPNGEHGEGAIANRKGVRDISLQEVQDMKARRVKLLVPVLGPAHLRIERLRQMPYEDLRWVLFSHDFRTQLKWENGGSCPNTGVVAIHHLLNTPLARLDLYGFDFFATGHFPGYNNETPEFAATAGRRLTDQGHPQEPIIESVARLWVTDHRLNLTPEAEWRIRSMGYSR